MAAVHLQIDDGVATLTLDDAPRRNALSADLVDDLVAALDSVEHEHRAGAVVITGAAPAFCAGADLSQLGASQEAGLRHIYEGFLRVGRCPLPTLAAVNGAAVGAGMNLALVCDVRLAGRSARFDTRFLQLGIHPGGGHTWMLERIVGPQSAAALVLFGEVLDGERAAQVGLAWRCTDDDTLLAEAKAMAARAAAAPPELASRTKQTLRDMPAIDTHELALERELLTQLWSMEQPAFAQRLRALQQRIASDPR